MLLQTMRNSSYEQWPHSSTYLRTYVRISAEIPVNPGSDFFSCFLTSFFFGWREAGRTHDNANDDHQLRQFVNDDATPIIPIITSISATTTIITTIASGFFQLPSNQKQTKNRKISFPEFTRRFALVTYVRLHICMCVRPPHIPHS